MGSGFRIGVLAVEGEQLGFWFEGGIGDFGNGFKGGGKGESFEARLVWIGDFGGRILKFWESN